MSKTKEPRVNIRISRKAYEALKRKAEKEDRSIISALNILCGV